MPFFAVLDAYDLQTVCLNRSDLRAVRWVPENRRAIVAATRKQVPIRREGDRTNDSGVTGEHLSCVAGCDIPENHGFVCAARGDRSAFGRKSYRSGRFFVAYQHLLQLACFGIPETCLVARVANGGNRLPIWGKCDHVTSALFPERERIRRMPHIVGESQVQILGVKSFAGYEKDSVELLQQKPLKVCKHPAAIIVQV